MWSGVFQEPPFYLFQVAVFLSSVAVLRECVRVYVNRVIFQSVPAALGRLQVGWVCGKPQGEVSGCMLHAPLDSVRVTRQPLVWPASNQPQWKLEICCGGTIQAFPLKMGATLFILGRSLL